MKGWDETVFTNGPGSISFVLVNGDIGTSPPAGPALSPDVHGRAEGHTL
jgi:hypothetical protein